MKSFIRSIFSFENFKAIIIAIGLATVIRGCAFELFRIPSGSMKDTLLIEDVLLVSKYAYGYGKYSFVVPIPIDQPLFYKEPERGDIVIFRKTDDDGKNYIKRLIGMPGEVIQIINGVIYINGIQIKQTEIKEENKSKEAKSEYNVYLEKLPNGCTYKVKYDIQSNSNQRSFPNSTPKYIIPLDHYFFMGDNRDHSIDSRFTNEMGIVMKNNLIGRADFIVITEKANPIKWILGKANDERLFTSLKCK